MNKEIITDETITDEERAQLIKQMEWYNKTPQEKFESYLSEIIPLLTSGEEQEVADKVISYNFYNDDQITQEVLKYICNHYIDDFIDESIVYNMIIQCYLYNGYNFPKQIMLKAKQLSRFIPDNIRCTDLPKTKEVTIYRATASTAEQAKKEISWTINKDVGIWFAYRFHEAESMPDLHLYQGLIDYDKIIAYTNDRNEYEVIQHRNVRDIIEIFPTEEEIERAMKAHKEAQ